MLEAVNGIKGDLIPHSQRIGDTEERISQTEDDVAALQGKVKQLERTVESLREKVQDQEDWSRQCNSRLVCLPEKTEGSDLCTFLENLLPKFIMTPVIEWAHRIGPFNPSQSTYPRTVIIKFFKLQRLREDPKGGWQNERGEVWKPTCEFLPRPVS